MFQFPQLRFNNRDLKKTSDSGLISRLKGVLSLGLAALLFFGPLGFTILGQEPPSDSKKPGAEHFVIFQNWDGETVCREATSLERRQLDEINPKGLQKITHLSGAPKGMNSVQSENALPAHLTIILRGTAQLEQHQQAKAAFIRAAQSWENQVKSPVTIYIDVDFGTTNFGTPWEPGVLGATTSYGITSSYQSVRNNLIAGASTSAETSLYNSLPASSLPTNGGAATTIAVSQSIARAIGFLDPTAPNPDTNPQDTTPRPRIGFNSNFQFDFDPSNGISVNQTDFEAVATHEIGHALGFTSRAGGTVGAAPAIWDIFRFRTGRTLSNFGSSPRILTADGLQYYFSGSPEVGLSTGGPSGDASGGDGNQSSHWKQQSLNGGQYVGIMDPKIPSGIRRRITTNDTIALDSFGYNLDNSNPPPPPPPPPPVPANNDFANSQLIPVGGCAGSVSGTNLGANKQTGEPSHSPDGDPGGASVWYRWQSPFTGSVTMTTAGSNYDTELGVYTGNSVNALTLIAKNDDVDSGVVTTSTVTFSASVGTVYKIAVDGYGGDAGNILLNWTRNGCAQSSALVRLSNASYSVGEGAGKVQITVTRTDTSVPATVGYATSDTAGLAACTVINGSASERCDYQTSVGTLRFAATEASKSITIPVIDDAHAEGNETFSIVLSSATGALLGSIHRAGVTIVDNSTPTQNPIEDPEFFITQQYIDFLGRLPDSSGLANWSNTLNGCPNGGYGTNNPDCDRVHVSAGFFLSEEFRGRGYWAFRFYEVALNRRPTYEEFVPDMSQVGGSQSPDSEALSKTTYTDEFAQRSAFKTRYDGLSNTAYVNALEQNAEITLSNKSALVNSLNTNQKSRAQVLREIVETKAVEDRFYVRAFVAMQYFGYLRRNPDTLGYNNWVTTLTNDPADYRHMIFGFIYSDEYRFRFGPQ